jgi:hypothetical protein
MALSVDLCVPLPLPALPPPPLPQIAAVIRAHPEFSRELDLTPRPGTKNYPRWQVFLRVYIYIYILYIPDVFFRLFHFIYIPGVSWLSLHPSLHVDCVPPLHVRGHACEQGLAWHADERPAHGQGGQGRPLDGLLHVPLDVGPTSLRGVCVCTPCRKDALVGCFKAGRYPHLVKVGGKREGLTVYRLESGRMTNAARWQLQRWEGGVEVSLAVGGEWVGRGGAGRGRVGQGGAGRRDWEAPSPRELLGACYVPRGGSRRYLCEECWARMPPCVVITRHEAAAAAAAAAAVQDALPAGGTHASEGGSPAAGTGPPIDEWEGGGNGEGESLEEGEGEEEGEEEAVDEEPEG